MNAPQRPAVAETEQVSPTAQTAVPAQRLNADQIYRVLAAESLLKQGDAVQAAEIYVDLARHYQDAAMAQRAFELVLLARHKPLLLEATRLNASLNSGEEAHKLSVYTALLADDVPSAMTAWLQLYDQLVEQEMEEKYIYLSIADLARENVSMPTLLAFSEQVAIKKPSAYAEFLVIMLAAGANAEDQAYARLQTAVKQYPDVSELAQLMLALVRQQEDEAGLAWLTDYVERNPGEREIAEQLARLYVAFDQIDAAQALYQQLLQEQHSDRLALALAIVELELKNGEAAETRLLSVKNTAIFGDMIAYYLGQAYFLQGKVDLAMAQWQSIDGDEYRLEAAVWQTQVLFDEKRTAEALAVLSAFEVRNEQDALKITQLKAHVYAYEEQYAQAIEVLSEAIAAYPEVAELWYQRANMKYLSDDGEGFEQDIRQAYLLSPEEADILNSLGYYLADNGKSLVEARSLLEKANDLLPNKHYIIDSLGWLAYQEGDYTQALSLLEQAYTLRADPEILRHRLIVLLALQRDLDAKALAAQEAAQFDDAELQQFLQQMSLMPWPLLC